METASDRDQLDVMALARYAVVESTEYGVIVVDAHGRVVDVNPSAQEILVQTAVEMISQPAKQALSNWPLLLGLLQERSGGRAEMELEHAGRRRVFDVQVSSLHDENANHIGRFIVLRDVTGPKQVEEDLQKAKDAAEAANQAKSEFMSVASHEMRIPITCIKGYTDLLAKGTAGPIDESQAEFLATIGTNADRLTRLVSDLSDIARIETGRLRLEVSRVELARVVREIAEGMQTQFAKKDQVLKVDVPEQLPAAYGDRDRLAQVTSPPLTVKP